MSPESKKVSQVLEAAGLRQRSGPRGCTTMFYPSTRTVRVWVEPFERSRLDAVVDALRAAGFEVETGPDWVCCDARIPMPQNLSLFDDQSTVTPEDLTAPPGEVN